MHDSSGGRVAGVQQVSRPAMIAFLARHRANERQLLGHACGVFPVLGDVNAGRRCGNGASSPLRFRPGLGIECLELARSACHPHQDAGLLLLLQLIGVHR